MDLYTIGFKEKSAKEFFQQLISKNIVRLIDIRVNNNNYEDGFAKGEDLRYFLCTIANIEYIYMPSLAPTENLRIYFRRGMLDYEKSYIELLDEREVTKDMDYTVFENACLLCSGNYTVASDREIVGNYLRNHNPKIKLIHL